MGTKNFDFKIWMKANWKTVLIIVLSLMMVSKCSQSCTRGQKIKKLNNVVAVQDSTITDMTYKLENANGMLELSKEHNESFTSIASGNQAELVRKIGALSDENAKLKKLNVSLSKENASLREKVELTEQSK